MREEKYIGLIEHNENEGEDFGYYFPDTPENQQKLEEFIKMIEDKFPDSVDFYSLELDASTERELTFVERGADNGYMARVNYVPEPEATLNAMLLIDREERLPYKGGFESEGEEYTLK